MGIRGLMGRDGDVGGGVYMREENIYNWIGCRHRNSI